jgi:hypothetical protein
MKLALHSLSFLSSATKPSLFPAGALSGATFVNFADVTKGRAPVPDSSAMTADTSAMTADKTSTSGDSAAATAGDSSITAQRAVTIADRTASEAGVCVDVAGVFDLRSMPLKSTMVSCLRGGQVPDGCF